MDSVSSLLIKMRPKLSWRNATNLAHILWTNFGFSLHLHMGSFRCESMSAAMFWTPGRYSGPCKSHWASWWEWMDLPSLGISTMALFIWTMTCLPSRWSVVTISQWEGMEPRGTPLTDKLSFSEGISLRPWLSYIGVFKSQSPNHWPMLAKFVVRGILEVCQPCDPPNTWNNEVVVYPSRRGRDSQSQGQEWPWWTWFTGWGLIISSLSSK